METHIYTTPTSVICIDEETGKAIWQLTTKQIAALREAGEKMHDIIEEFLSHDGLSENSKRVAAALAEWEAANK